MISLSRLNYYGNDKKTFNECQSLINEYNYNTLRISSALAFAFLSAYTVVSILLVQDTRETISCCIFDFCLGLICLITFCRKEFSIKHSSALIYMGFTILLAYGIAATIPFPTSRAVSFPLLLVLIPVLFVSKAITMTSYITVMSIIFVFVIRDFKTSQYFIMECFNALTFSLISIFVHFFIQQMKIKSFVTRKQNELLIQKYELSQHLLETASSIDSLSHLLNRGTFLSAAKKIIKNFEEGFAALCILDMDHFKELNDSYGHQAGDKAIQTLGKIITYELKITLNLPKLLHPSSGDKINFSKNLAGRLGGDEFMLLITSVKDKKELEKILSKLLEEINATQIKKDVRLEASIGYATFRKKTDFDAVYKKADIALYKAKENGRNRFWGR